MGNGKPGQAGLGPGATTGSGFITNFTAGTGSRTGKRRYGSRVVVGLHLDLERKFFSLPDIGTAVGIDEKAFSARAGKDG